MAITYGLAHCDLGQHRDYWDEATNQWVCGFHPAGQADDAVLIGRVTDGTGTTIATLVNYACHPTTLAWDNQLISPDYVGAMREVIERETDAPCVFLQGASGDIGPREGFVGDTDVADRNGRQLGFTALSTITALPPARSRFEYAGPVVSGATIGTWQHQPLADAELETISQWRVCRIEHPIRYRADLPTRADVEREREELLAAEATARASGDDEKARELRALVERLTRLRARLGELPEGDAYPFAINAWRMGDAVWVFVQAEPYNLLQRELRRRHPDNTIFVVTLTDDWGPSYLPPEGSYGKGIYQESIAVLEAGCLESLIEACSQVVTDCLA